MKPDQIILHPLVTEKTATAEKGGKYIFKVLKQTNKNEVKKAVERLFSVKVDDVNILNTSDKTKRRGKKSGNVPGFKKAIVTLKKGQSIKLREEKKEEKKKEKPVKKKEEVKEDIKES